VGERVRVLRVTLAVLPLLARHRLSSTVRSGWQRVRPVVVRHSVVRWPVKLRLLLRSVVETSA
jgi:hypothetical protein